MSEGYSNLRQLLDEYDRMANALSDLGTWVNLELREAGPEAIVALVVDFLSSERPALERFMEGESEDE